MIYAYMEPKLLRCDLAEDRGHPEVRRRPLQGSGMIALGNLMPLIFKFGV
jgi:hypothetical protein